MINGKFAVSSCGESYTCLYETYQEAVIDGASDLGLGKGDTIFIGKTFEYAPPMPTAKDFFANICESDFNNLGDFSEFWESGFSKKTDLHKEIDKKFKEIKSLILKHHKPCFYMVEDIKKETVFYQ